MEFIADWQSVNAPHRATIAALVIALALVTAFAIPLVKTARKVGHYRAQSLALLAVPALVIVGGVAIDNHRADSHRELLAEQGVIERSWNEIEEQIQERYLVGDVEPTGDVAEVLDHIKAVGTSNVSNSVDPTVVVQHHDSTHTGVYRLVATQTESGDIVLDLARQTSLELSGEGVDPQAFLIN